MKKFIPLVSVLGITSLLVCANTTPNENKHNDFYQDVASFSNTANLSSLDPIKNIQKNIKDYSVRLNIPADATLVDSELENIEKVYIESQPEEDNEKNLISENDIQNDTEKVDAESLDNDPNDSNITTLEEPIVEEIIEDNEDNIDIENDIDNEDEKLLTIYSLSKDIESTCDKYCELKNLLTETILESQTLIERIKTNQIELNAEQRLFLNEQSNELKNLGKELIRNNNELNVYLKDINGYLTNQNTDIDSLSVKYLLLLNNLMEGEGIMNHSLASLYLMNNLMRMTPQYLPENNIGKILYGFQRNNEPPIIRNFDIDKNGNIIEANPSNNSNINSTEQVNAEIEEKENEKYIDTYKGKKLQSNIDSYRNNNNNIDSFFNTALLDNELMFGGNGMNYGGGFYPMMYGGNFGGYNNAYPNNFNYQNNYNDGTYRIDNNNNTQHVQNDKTIRKKKKSKKLKKNVDTYRDDNTPNPKQRFKNLKAKIASIFNSKNNDKINSLKK